jgi:hypothetical protein
VVAEEAVGGLPDDGAMLFDDGRPIDHPGYLLGYVFKLYINIVEGEGRLLQK